MFSWLYEIKVNTNLLHVRLFVINEIRLGWITQRDEQGSSSRSKEEPKLALTQLVVVNVQEVGQQSWADKTEFCLAPMRKLQSLSFYFSLFHYLLDFIIYCHSYFFFNFSKLFAVNSHWEQEPEKGRNRQKELRVFQIQSDGHHCNHKVCLHVTATVSGFTPVSSPKLLSSFLLLFTSSEQ